MKRIPIPQPPKKQGSSSGLPSSDRNLRTPTDKKDSIDSQRSVDRSSLTAKCEENITENQQQLTGLREFTKEIKSLVSEITVEREKLREARHSMGMESPDRFESPANEDARR